MSAAASETRLSLCFVQTSIKVWQPLSAHPLPLSIRRIVSERLWKCSNHTWNPNICTKDTVPLEENSIGNNRAFLWGKHLPLTRPSVWSFFSPRKWFSFKFCRTSTRQQFSRILPYPFNICEPTVNQCQCLCKLYRFRNIKNDSCVDIHMATAKQQPYSVGWAPGVMSNCFNSG